MRSYIDRSFDGGITWDTIEFNFPHRDQNGSFGIVSLIAGETYLYAINGNEFFRSSDGEVWSNITGNIEETFAFGTLGVSGDDLIVQSQTMRTYRFNGTEWSELPVSMVNNIVADDRGGIIFSTYDGDLLEVTAEAPSEPHSIVGDFVRSTISSIGAVGSTVIANTSGRTYRSENDGATWEEIEDLKGIYSASFYTHGNAIYALNGTPYRSFDQGKRWEMFGPEYPFDVEGPDFYRSVSAIAQTDNAIYLGLSEYSSTGAGGWSDGGIFRSVDGGETWQRAEKGLPRDGFTTAAPVRSLLSLDNDHLIASVAGGIYRSDNGGDQWYPSTGGISEEDRLYGGTLSQVGDRLYLTTYTALYESVDRGITWRRIEPVAGMEDGANIAVFDLDGELYVQSYRWSATGPIEYHLAKQNGKGWIDVSNWQPTGVTFTSMVRLGDNYFGGTNGAGVWRLDRNLSIGTSGVATDERGTRLDGVTSIPNPSTGRAIVRLNAEKSGRAMISITNSLGTEVLRTDGEITQQGTNSIALDLSSLPSGTYFITVELPGGTGVKRGQIQIVR